MNRQQPSPMPSHRYRDVFARVPVAPVERTWPDSRISTAPLWVPVDLRDGNQALAEPMDPERKRRGTKRNDYERSKIDRLTAQKAVQPDQQRQQRRRRDPQQRLGPADVNRCECSGFHIQ